MKIRKELDHVNLVAEATKQLSARFQPTPQGIKKRIVEGTASSAQAEKSAAGVYRLGDAAWEFAEKAGA